MKPTIKPSKLWATNGATGGTEGRLTVAHKGLNSAAGGLNAQGSQPAPEQAGYPAQATGAVQGFVAGQNAQNPQVTSKLSDQQRLLQLMMMLGLGDPNAQ